MTKKRNNKSINRRETNRNNRSNNQPEYKYEYTEQIKLIRVLGYLGVGCSSFGVIQALIELCHKSLFFINIFTISACIIWYLSLLLGNIFSLRIKRSSLVMYNCSASMMMLASVCLMVVHVVNSSNFSKLTIGINLGGIFINRICNTCIKENINPNKYAVSNEDSNIRDKISLLLITGISLVGIILLFVKLLSGYTLNKLSDSLYDTFIIIGLITSVVIFICGILEYCNPSNNNNILSAAAKNIYASGYIIFIEMVDYMCRTDSIVQNIIELGCGLAICGYSSAFISYFFEVGKILIKKLPSTFSGLKERFGIINTKKSIEKPAKRSIFFEYDMIFELEATIVKDAYDEILKNNDMSYYRNLGITFEEVDEFQTKMKFSKRRPFLYNLSSSLAIKYDKKLEQRINQELLTKIKKNIYVEA